MINLETQKKIIESNGHTKQCSVIQEELMELSIEVGKLIQGDSIRSSLVSEMADALNQIEALKLMCNISEQELAEARARSFAKACKVVGINNK